MKTTKGINIFSTAIFVPILILGILNVGAVGGVFVSPTLHVIAMIIVGITGLLAWYYAYRGFHLNGSHRLVVIGTGLLIGGVLLAGYGLFSFGINGAEYAEWYSRLGIALLALFLFLAAGFKERRILQVRRKGMMIGFFVLAIVLVIISRFLIEAAVQSDVLVASTAGHWTPLGRFIQIAAIMFLTVAAIRFLHGAFLIRSELALALATATVLLVIAELTYTAIQQPFDVFFWAAHLWWIMGFIAFLWGGVASRETHLEEHLG